MTTTWKEGDRVQVSLPYGLEGGKTFHKATVEQVVNSRVSVRFDDPLIYGGQGWAWVDESALVKQ